MIMILQSAYSWFNAGVILKMLGLHSLEHRRLNYDLILVYKILNGLIDIIVSSSFHLQQSSTRDHSFTLVKSYCSHDTCKYLYCSHITATWN